MVDAINRAQQDYVRRMIRRRRGYQLFGDRNGQRRKMEAVDHQRRTTRDAELDAILAADNGDLDAELARLDRL